MVKLENKDSRLKEGEQAATVSIVVSFLLSLAKAVAGYFSGSVVLITDAIHSAADSMTGVASWFGLRISQKRPSERFPYGYYKAENLATLVVSAFILYASIEMMLEGYSRLFVLPALTRPYEALAVALTSSIISYFLSRHMKSVGEKINSQSLIANSKERKVDILSSLIVFVAILLTFYKIPYVEGVITVFISLFALKIGIEVARDSVFALMDVSPSLDVEQKIIDILKNNKGVESFDNLRLRKAGPLIFGEVNVKVRKHTDVKRAHEIAESIENKIKREVKELESLTIHVEPYKTEKEKVAIPIKTKNGLNSKIMHHFGRANHFIFITISRKTGKIESSYIKENPHKKDALRAGFKTAKFIVKERIDSLITYEIGEISFHTVRDNLVDVYKAEGETVKDVVKKYMDRKLKLIKGPTKELGELSGLKNSRKGVAEGGIAEEAAPNEIVSKRGVRKRRRGPWWKK